ncbi:F-box protein, partial [Trifolium pratense]
DDDFSDCINDYEFSDSMNINDSNFPFLYLSKRSIFLIKPPQQQQQDTTLVRRPWLVRITQNSFGKTKISQPDTSLEPIFPSIDYSNMLDFNELSVLHLGTAFIMEDDRDLWDPYYDYLHPRTVLAVTCHGKKPLVVGAMCFVTPRPMLFRDNDERWRPISSSTYYGDICVFNGRIYSVNVFGRIVVVGPESTVQLVAQPLVDGGSHKLLVESEGKLLLVNVYQSYPDFFGIDLFQLDEKENKWVKLKDIGDRVLFLACGCSFSAYASELGLPKGNCVVFFDNSVLCIGNVEDGNRVFHLDQDRLSPVSEYPEYLNLFLPPEWILKS